MMTSEQKLHRALTKLIYEYFEEMNEVYTPNETYIGENEDYLINCIYKLKGIAKKYHKDKTNELKARTK